MPMDDAFVGGVGLVFGVDGVGRGLDVRFPFVEYGKEYPQASLASRKERTYRKSENAGPSPKNRFSLARSDVMGRTSTTMNVHQ